MSWGSNLFHIGVLGIFFGHIGGLLVPLEFWHSVGVSIQAKQMIAIYGGGTCGVLGIIGAILLAQLVLGLLTIPVSLQHMDGGEMIKLVEWAQHIWTFHGGARLPTGAGTLIV